MAKKEEKTEEKEEFTTMTKGAITVISPLCKIKEYEQIGIYHDNPAITPHKDCFYICKNRSKPDTNVGVRPDAITVFYRTVKRS